MNPLLFSDQRNLPQYGGAAIFTECFSIAKIPDGYVTSCGQGMETEKGGGVLTLSWLIQEAIGEAPRV